MWWGLALYVVLVVPFLWKLRKRELSQAHKLAGQEGERLQRRYQHEQQLHRLHVVSLVINNYAQDPDIAAMQRIVREAGAYKNVIGEIRIDELDRNT